MTLNHSNTNNANCLLHFCQLINWQNCHAENVLADLNAVSDSIKIYMISWKLAVSKVFFCGNAHSPSLLLSLLKRGEVHCGLSKKQTNKNKRIQENRKNNKKDNLTHRFGTNNNNNNNHNNNKSNTTKHEDIIDCLLLPTNIHLYGRDDLITFNLHFQEYILKTNVCYSPRSVFGSVIYSYITFREKDPPSTQGATASSDAKKQTATA